MIEILVIDYITQMGVPCFAEEPEKPPKKYCIIDRTGTVVRDHITTVTIAVQCYGATLLDALELNSKSNEHMERMTERADIARCALVSAYAFNDTVTHRYRYQSVFEITYNGSDINGKC